MAMKAEVPAYGLGEMRVGFELSVYELQVLHDLCTDWLVAKGPSADSYALAVASALKELDTMADLTGNLYGRKADND